MEEPVNVYPRCVGCNKSCSKTSKMGVPADINENIRLEDCEGVIKVGEKGPTILTFLWITSMLCRYSNPRAISKS